MQDSVSPRTKPCESRIPRCGQRSAHTETLPNALRQITRSLPKRLQGIAIPSLTSSLRAIANQVKSKPYILGSNGHSIKNFVENSLRRCFSGNQLKYEFNIQFSITNQSCVLSTILSVIAWCRFKYYVIHQCRLGPQTACQS